MKLVETGSVSLSDIEVGKRLRDVDMAVVAGLVPMIEATGLQHPVQLLRIGNRLMLGAGAHRLKAFEVMGRPNIPAHVYEADTAHPEDELRLLEIVENVGRRELSPLDRAAHVTELKKVYLKLYGANTGGRPGKTPANIAGVSRQGLWSMPDDVAAKMGLSERTVRADVEFFERLTPEVRRLVAGTWLAENRAQLVLLSKLDDEDQAAVVELLFGKGGDSPGKNVAHATALHFNQVDSSTPDEKHYAQFVKLWARASKKTRKQIASHIAKFPDGGQQ